MAQFQIKKGLSTNLFDNAGNLLITPEEGCWYITIDTFQLYTCFNGKVKKVGEVEDFGARLSKLEERVEKIIQTYGYKSALPLKGEENVIYLITDENAQYYWSEAANSYLCVGRDYNEISIIDGGNA